MVIVYFIYNNNCNNNVIEKMTNNHRYEFILYYVPWCPYCKDVYNEENSESKPWNKIMDYLSNNKINDYHIDCKVLNCDENIDECKNNNVKSYPTILLKDNYSNDSIIYNNNRSYDEFINFLNDSCV